MNLKTIILSEKSQSYNVTYCRPLYNILEVIKLYRWRENTSVAPGEVWQRGAYADKRVT